MTSFKFPFKDQAGKEVRNADLYYDALTMASSGYYPLGPSGVHCGIHYESAMANTLALVDGIGAIAKGEVVAYRVNRRYLGVRGRATPPMSDKVLYSSGFVLTRHSLEYPAGNKLTYFCLAMHLRSFEEYERLGARAKRPPYWTAKIYRVSEQADDKQDATAGSAATRMTGLRVRAEPSAGTTPILGILPHGARIIGREIHDRKWVRIQALIEGDMAPLNTGDAAPETSAAIDGWVFLKSLTEQSQVPDAFDEVVFPTPPLKVKAGALLGHLGEYQRIADPGSSRPMLHHEIIVGPDLPAYLHKSRAAAKSAKPEHKTLLRMAPSAQLYNAVLAPAQSGLLSAGTVIELESAPPDDAVYVNVKPAATLQWIDRTAKLPAGAREARLYRHSNTGAYTAADIIAEARRGTAGQAGATGYRGIFVDASDQTPIWIAKNTYRGLHPLGKQKLLLSDVAQGWDSYPLTFAANGHKNGAFPQHFAISTLEQARPATPDPASEPIGFALDEAGKRWWQVQLKDGITSAIGWLGEENHPGISVHSPHEWVDFSVIEAESQTPAYGSYFLTLAEMAAFQRGEKALQKNQLDTPLQEVFDTLDSHPDGALTLGELQAAQRSRSTLQRLSRIILRYPTEWKADPQAWAHYDAEIPPSNRDAWESEKQRMGELVWWDEVGGKVDDFLSNSQVFHIHPVAFSTNLVALPVQCPHCGVSLMLTSETLRIIFPEMSEKDSFSFSIELQKVVSKYEINTCFRLAHFLGQCEAECGGFTTFHEDLYYPDGERLWNIYRTALTNGLRRLHPSWTKEQMKEYTKTSLIKNDVGLGKVLFGGGGSQELDYRGRGLLHLTWFESYNEYRKYSGIDIVSDPKLVQSSAFVATDTAGWFWLTRGINKLADENKPTLVTGKVNPALDQLARRKTAARRAFELINRGNNPCRENWISTLKSENGW